MIIRQGGSGLGANPTDSYYDPNRPTWMPYWMNTASEAALKLSLYPGANSLQPLPVPITPVPQVPTGALDYTAGGSSTSVPLNQASTTPDWFGSASGAMSAAALQIQNEQAAAANPSSTLTWVLAGVAAVLLLVAMKR